MSITDKTKYNNPMYRTIDHKTSIFNGYMENIEPSIIGGINNLCICSRIYNTTKGIKCND